MTSPDALVDVITLLSRIAVFETDNFDRFLKKLVLLISKVIALDSCLIYVYSQTSNRYILVASKQKHTKLLHKISLKTGEGITGWVGEHKQHVVLSKEAYKDKRFKSFTELPEDTYEAFLSLPIISKQGTIGVINLQNKQPYYFSKEELGLLKAIVTIIAAAFEKQTLSNRVATLEQKLEERKVVEKAKGVLMKHKGLSENDAYQTLRDEAMKKRKSIKTIAEAVILIMG